MNNNNYPVKIDDKQALQHTNMLASDAKKFLFVAIRVAVGEVKSHVVVIFGGYEGLKHQLNAYQNKGYSIYVLANESLSKDRTKDDIDSYRTVWQDDDHGAGGDSFPIEPTMVIETSKGKFHRYFAFTNPVPNTSENYGKWTGIFNCLVNDHGSDKLCRDTARIMRLAGSYNMKDAKNPVMARIIDHSGQRYDFEELTKIFKSKVLKEALEVKAPEEKTRGNQSYVFDDSDPFAVAKTLAIENLSLWVYDLGLYGVEPYQDGFRAVNNSRPSGSGNPTCERKKNLLFSTLRGINDFGGDTYSPISIIMLCLSMTNSEALTWLEGKLASVIPLSGLDRENFTANGVSAKSSKNSSNSSSSEGGAEKLTFKSEWEALPKKEEIKSDPYPMEAVPHSLRAVILENNEYSQTPIEMDATVCFCSVSAAAQSLIVVKRDKVLKSSCSIYSLIVADSGERKTQIEKTFNAPILEWEADQREKAVPKFAKYNSAKTAWDSKKRGIASAIALNAKKGKDTESLEQDLFDNEKDMPVKPASIFLVHTDITAQELAHLQGCNYPPAYISISEGGIFFGGHSLSGENLMFALAYYNSRYSNELFNVGRRGSESFIVNDAPLTMLLMVQDKVLKAFFKRDQDVFRGSGMFARNLFAQVETTQGERAYKPPLEDQPQYKVYKKRMRELLNIPLNLQDGGVKPPEIGLSKDGFKEWVSFYNETEATLRKGGNNEDIKDIVSKIAENAARLAGIFHVYEIGNTGEISERNMKSAISIVSWHLKQAQVYLSDTVGQANDHGAGSLEAWLFTRLKDAKTDHLSLREISQFAPYALRKKSARDKAISVLVSGNRARLISIEKKTFLQLHPDLLKNIATPSATATPAIFATYSSDKAAEQPERRQV